MKVTEKEFMGLPLLIIHDDTNGEHVNLNIIIKWLDEDIQQEIDKILKDEIFKDSVIYFESSNGNQYFINEKHFYGWLFFSFPGHPELKEFSTIASSVISKEVRPPLQFQEN